MNSSLFSGGQSWTRAGDVSVCLSSKAVADTPGRPSLARWGVAVLAVACACGLKLTAGRWLSADAEVAFFAAVAVAAWYGGARVGILATALASAAQLYFFIAPHYSFAWPGSVAAVQLTSFVLEGFLFCGLWELVARGHKREASQIAALANARAAEESAREQRAFFEATPVPMFIFDMATRHGVAVNDAALRLYGYKRAEFLALDASRIAADDGAHESRMRAPPGEFTARHRTKDGSILHVELTARAIGEKLRSVAVVDVSHTRLLEEQLRQAQKMEAVGRLAGGVAHDFNNALSVILSYTDLMLDDVDPSEPRHADLCEMRIAATHAADLTRQLLLFSRQSVVEAQVLDLNDVVQGVAKILPRLLGADVELVSIAHANLGLVKVDRGHVEQVVMNLAVNARDAMPSGGKLVIETANVLLDSCAAHRHRLEPGPYVTLTVRDSGVGMSDDTRARIFEPFFTTKAIGEGTGLGLSTVFGIVQQSAGSISVESTIGKGTTFVIYLPTTSEARSPSDSQFRRSQNPKGNETILLVEDDDQVRTVTRDVLERSGYIVIEARSAGDALLHCENDGPSIDLLLTDVVMPQMSGYELARRVSCKDPKMRVLCMSGYAEAAAREGIAESETPFLQKPVTPENLTRKVRAVLEAPRRPAAQAAPTFATEV